MKTAYSQALTLADQIAGADLVVGATLVPGKLAPKLIPRALLRRMRPGSVLVDISIDQGGIAETSRPTSHSEPIYVEEGVIHYCVPNMPSVVARTSTYAFLNAAMPFILELVNKGVDQAIAENPAIAHGVGTYQGKIRHISSLSPMAQME